MHCLNKKKEKKEMSFHFFKIIFVPYMTDVSVPVKLAHSNEIWPFSNVVSPYEEIIDK